MRLPAALAVIVLLAGCAGGGLPVAEPPAELQEFEAELTVKGLWSRGVGEGVGERYLQLGPQVDGEVVYAADADGSVIAFSAETGARQWRSDLDVAVSGGPGDGGDLLLLGGDAQVIALSKEDGSERWRAPVSSEVLAAPVRAGSLVLARTVDGNLFALDAGSGEERWRYNQSVPALSLRGVAPPVAYDGRALAGFANGRLMAVDLSSGTPVWGANIAVPRGRTELERLVDVDAAPVAADGLAHVAAYQGRVATLSLDDGRALWVRDIPSHHALAVSGDSVFVTDDSSDVWALTRFGGTTLWRSEALHARRLTAPAVQGDYLVVGDLDGYLHWLHRDDGRLAARARVGGEPILAAPVVVGERVYAIDTAGELAAFRVSPR